jgi:hypothetical protein
VGGVSDQTRPGRPWLFTSRYAEPAVASFDGLKIRTTVGYPRFLKLSYQLDDYVKELAPHGIFGKGLSEQEFTTAYRQRLDRIGTDTIRARLDELHAASPSGRVVLLCFEPIGRFCHRRLFADWAETALDLVVPELQSASSPG